MRNILIIVVVCFLSSGCGRAEEKAETMRGLMDDCEAGSTATMELAYGTWANSISFSCTWMVKADTEAKK